VEAGISPLLAHDLSGLPPALIVVAGFDVLRDEGEAYAAALSETGTHCLVQREPSLAHGFVQLTAVSPAAHRATVAMAERWRTLLNFSERPS
jgi:acetyl esterase